MSLRMRRSIRINAQGKQLNKFINAIHQHRIDCRGQYCRSEVFYCDIYRRDLQELRDIAEKYGIELKAAEYDSLFARLFRYRRRLGIIIGILLVLTAALYFSQVVVTIEIEGNSAVSDEVILSALEELDIKAGTPICRINIPYCENRLRLMIDDVAWAGIRHTGSRLVVQVTEVRQVPEMLRDRVPCNIVVSSAISWETTSPRGQSSSAELPKTMRAGASSTMPWEISAVSTRKTSASPHRSVPRRYLPQAGATLSAVCGCSV